MTTPRRNLIFGAMVFAGGLMLTGCGQRADLAYAVGAPGPAVPAGEARAPTPPELVTPTIQARPKRSDELLRQSDERQADEFELPPT